MLKDFPVSSSAMSLPSGRYRIIHQASSNIITLPNGRHNTAIILAPYSNSPAQLVSDGFWCTGLSD